MRASSPDPREADFGSILGSGYALYSGGALSFIDGIGLKAFVARAKELAAKYGPQFELGEKLVQMAERGDVLRSVRRETESGLRPRRIALGGRQSAGSPPLIDLLGDGDAILGDARRAAALLNHDIAALRAQRHADRSRERRRPESPFRARPA
jgi:hypothetical protein